MTAPIQTAPASEADLVMAEVQARAMRIITWWGIIAAPIVFVLSELNNRTLHDPSWLYTVARYVILLGPLLQFLLRNRLSPWKSSVIFGTWLSVICSIAFIHLGALMGSGIGWAVLILTAVFFMGRRAGAVVVGYFALLVATQLLGVHQGWLDYPRDLALGSDPAARLSTLLRIDISAVVVLLICYGLFSLMHHTLKRALFRMDEEKGRRDTAEAAQQRAEEIMKANQHYEALGKLVSGVAHDVNNALTSVLGHAELLKYSLPEGEEQTYAQDIISAARSAAHTTRQLLSLNRRTLCQPISVHPGQVVETVSRLVRRLMPETVALTVDCQTECMILVDPADLQQALLNLLLNARDALPNGGSIAIRVTEQPAGAVSMRHIIRIEVADSGVGIPPEVLPRIFEPFFTTKPVGHGTGLGLAMVRLFVDEAGGQISVTSKPGAGTTIGLVFPESPLPLDAGLPFADDLAVPATGQSILVVEDQPELSALMQRVLSRGGYTVRVVASAEAALAVLAGPEKFGLLCTDGILGPIPVHRVIDKFREHQPNAPVLICSGHMDDELVRGGVAAREIDLLRKPFTGTELLARVRQTLHSPRGTGRVKAPGG